jgi:hypothetical protein
VYLFETRASHNVHSEQKTSRNSAAVAVLAPAAVAVWVSAVVLE